MERLIKMLGRLFEYPGADYRRVVAEATDLAADYDDAIYLPMRRFFDTISTKHQAQLEDVFTTTFDLNPTCNPEVGWHIWGEDYNRGAFMADLRDEFARYGIEERGELPDHLAHMLPLLAAMEVDAAEPLARRQVLPALAAMHEQLTKESSPYADLVAASIAAIKRQTGIEEDIGPPPKMGQSISMTFSSSLSSPSGGSDG